MDLLRVVRRGSGRLSRAALPTLFVLSLFFGGCGDGDVQEAPPDPHADLRERLAVAPEREIHRVTIRGRGGEEHVVPSSITVPVDAVIAFTSVDGRIHTVSFPRDSLPLDAALFLERTGQLQSPPLVDRGARFVVTLDGAPPGRYRFLVRGPGGEAWGALTVREEGS